MTLVVRPAKAVDVAATPVLESFTVFCKAVTSDDKEVIVVLFDPIVFSAVVILVVRPPTALAVAVTPVVGFVTVESKDAIF